MNWKTSINSIYPNLWAPTASLLQGLTVMHSVSTRWNLGMFIDTAVNNGEKRLIACVCTVGKHFKQFYCRQLKMDNWMKCQPKCQKCKQNVFLRVMLIKQSYRIGQKDDISLVVFSPGSAVTNAGWGGKLNGQVVSEIFVPKIIKI